MKQAYVIAESQSKAYAKPELRTIRIETSGSYVTTLLLVNRGKNHYMGKAGKFGRSNFWQY